MCGPVALQCLCVYMLQCDVSLCCTVVLPFIRHSSTESHLHSLLYPYCILQYCVHGVEMEGNNYWVAYIYMWHENSHYISNQLHVKIEEFGIYTLLNSVQIFCH